MRVVAMNGGSYFSPTPAISMFVTLEDAAMKKPDLAALARAFAD